MKKRIKYIDIIRGICIIYMIAGHIKFQFNEFDHYIHAFHMPIFFIVSGIFYKDGSIIKYLKKMTKKLLIPYFIWALFFLIIDNKTMIGNHIGLRNGLSIILTTNNDIIPIAGALWFLTSFFISNILFLVINKLIKNNIIQITICLLIMLIGVYLYKLTNINLWWSLNSSLVGVGLMEIGYILKQKNLLDKMVIKNYILLIGLIIINTICIMKTGYVNMRTNTYPNIILFIVNLLLSLVVYLNISKKIEKINFLSNWIQLLGNESIIPLCLNQFIILVYTVLIEKNIIVLLPGNYLIIIKLLIFVLSLITIYLLIKIISKTALKKLFGK